MMGTHRIDKIFIETTRLFVVFGVCIALVGCTPKKYVLPPPPSQHPEFEQPVFVPPPGYPDYEQPVVPGFPAPQPAAVAPYQVPVVHQQPPQPQPPISWDAVVQQRPPAPIATPARPAPGTKIQVPQLSPVRFGIGSFSLLDQAKDQLYYGAQWLLSNPDTKLIIEGHTDDTGTHSRNMEISKRRAEKTAEYLTKTLGVPADRIETVALGAQKPAQHGTTSVVREANRRCEFWVVY